MFEKNGWRKTFLKCFPHGCTLYLWKRLFAPQRGGQEEADRLFATQRGGQEEADRLFAPQRGGQEKQLCYSPRSAANKRFHFIIRPAADYVTRHLIGQFL